jgi:TolB-like protein
MDVLVALAERGGDVVAKRELLDRVWADTSVSEAVLTNAVSELRRALGSLPAGQGLIATVPRRGYRLTAPAAFDSPQPDAERSIAALPIEDLSPEHPSGPLLAAIHDALVGELARVPGFRVLARAATARYRPGTAPLDRIGRELRATNLVVGSAVRNGTRLRLDAQLVDAAAGRVRWSTSLVVGLGDPVEASAALASTLAREIAKALEVPLAPAPLSAPPLDQRTAELFLRGQLRLRGSTVESVEEGLADLDEVTRRLPDLAAAHAGLARGHFLLASWGADPAARRLLRAEQEAERSLALDPDSTEGRIWWTMARAFGRLRADDALWPLARLVRDHPRNPEARDALAHCLAALGRLSEAIAEERLALADDPLSPALRTALGFFLRSAGDLEGAESELVDALELHPDWTIARLELGRVRWAKGERPAAAAEIGRVEPDWARFLAAVVAGRQAEIRRALRTWSAAATVAPYWLAERCVWAGDHAGAIAALERALASRQLRLIYAGIDPTFAPLRRSARFRRLLARAGIELNPA